MKKIVALLLTAVMVLGCLPGLAENTKHERVYVVTAADGTVKSLTDSVRLENADGLDEIMDQTILTAIQNVGGHETFTLDGETLTWQANGKDITYLGTSDKAPALLPAVKLTLDGEEISFADLKDKTGDAVLTVSYQQQEALPILAVTVLPLPGEGITGLQVENAAVLSEMGRQVLVGWAVPGADEKLNLPTSFTASFHADHADLNWMMTLTTSDPVDRLTTNWMRGSALTFTPSWTKPKLLLTALQNGSPARNYRKNQGLSFRKINELNDGLTQLNDGAASLADGTAQLSSGASQLKDGAAQLNGRRKGNCRGIRCPPEAADAETGASASLDTGLAGNHRYQYEALNYGAQTIFASDPFICQCTACRFRPGRCWDRNSRTDS